ncbi:Glutamate 5-kinase 1 [Apilactobacillus kunkeei]|nr:Glutamate 5-kinase 1 [Apilactobacillus kunkeei]CAI2686955.1 Glutamate 5-kinase 1 [Apilactobacillus kunkeei]CAI2688092.1 Glutamate 5-kinase 1 [Apilactobacillus kunkeei]
MTSKYKRIVVKIGTSSIINSDNSINMKTIHTLSSVLSQLNQSGHEVILVTSGAVGVGMNTIGLKMRPIDGTEVIILNR